MQVSRRDLIIASGATMLAPDGVHPTFAEGQSVSAGKSNAGRVTLGLNLHIDRFKPATALLQLALAKAAGAQSIRGLTAGFGNILAAPGRWSFEKSDRDLALLESAAFDVFGGFGYGVAWASEKDPNHSRNPTAWSFYPPDDLTLWEEYVGKTVARYRGKVKCWSPWNEPDSYAFFMPLPGAGEKRDEQKIAARRATYLELQNRTFRAAKSQDPDVIVLSGGFAMGGDFDHDFLPWLAENGLMDVCDVIEVHTYWSIKNLENVINRAHEIMRKAGQTKPIWVTEFGAAVKSGLTPPFIGEVDHDHIADMAPKALATAKAMGAERFYWYQGYTEGNAPVALSNSSYSLAVTDGPTPAFWAFAATASLLRDAEYFAPADLQMRQGTAKGFIFRRGGNELAILWASSPDGLDNKRATAAGNFNWKQRDIPVQLSERPLALVL
jgi:hypothetical protein